MGERQDLHGERDRAESFGTSAEVYDVVRPSYPPALVDALVAGGPASVLDVGCGTGKLARLLLERGLDVLGVEPDERMAAVARRHGVTVEHAHFETWDAHARRWPLLVSGQAWHWVDPHQGAAKAAAVLEPGGLWAACWNDDRLPGPVRDAVDAVYTAHFPEALDSPLPEPEDHPAVAALDATGAFEAVHAHTFSWLEIVTPDIVLRRLSTHSIYGRLDDDRRSVLFAAIGGALAAEPLALEVETLLLSARRG